MNLGKSIRSIRKSKGWSQKDLCDRCGLTQTSLSQIETGYTDMPTRKNIKKICQVLDTPEFLLYLLSIEELDVPERNRKIYRDAFPAIEVFLKTLFK